MKIPATIPEQIDLLKDLEISYRTLHPSALLYDKQSDRTINIPFYSITNKYKNFLSNIIIEIELDKERHDKYMYKPKLVSNDFYSTTELWNDVLILNRCISVFDFKPDVLKLYDPGRLKDILNEIIVLEDMQR